MGLQNSAELALVYAKGSRVSVAHPYPDIPCVSPQGENSISVPKRRNFFCNGFHGLFDWCSDPLVKTNCGFESTKSG